MTESAASGPFFVDGDGGYCGRTAILLRLRRGGHDVVAEKADLLPETWNALLLELAPDEFDVHRDPAGSDCSCGHDEHQHDHEASPALCMVCGGAATCDLITEKEVEGGAMPEPYADCLDCYGGEDVCVRCPNAPVRCATCETRGAKWCDEHAHLLIADLSNSSGQAGAS